MWDRPDSVSDVPLDRWASSYCGGISPAPSRFHLTLRTRASIAHTHEDLRSKHRHLGLLRLRLQIERPWPAQLGVPRSVCAGHRPDSLRAVGSAVDASMARHPFRPAPPRHGRKSRAPSHDMLSPPQPGSLRRLMSVSRFSSQSARCSRAPDRSSGCRVLMRTWPWRRWCGPSCGKRSLW